MSVGTSQNQLVNEFKDLIKQVTVEVSKQAVISEIKKSEETIKQASSQLPNVATRLGTSAQKLDELLQKNSSELITLNKKVNKVDEQLVTHERNIKEKIDKKINELTKLFNDKNSELQSLSTSQTTEIKTYIQQELSALSLQLKSEETKQHTFRKAVFWLLSAQLLLLISISVGAYFLFK